MSARGVEYSRLFMCIHDFWLGGVRVDGARWCAVRWCGGGTTTSLVVLGGARRGAAAGTVLVTTYIQLYKACCYSLAPWGARRSWQVGRAAEQ